MRPSSSSDSSASGLPFVVFAFSVIMLGTTLPTALYPLYERTLRLAPVLTPIIFASYAAGVVIALVCLGYLSDEIGRKRMMLPALALSAASGVVFLLATSLAALLVGRVLSGLSSGIATGAATAWIVDLAGKRDSERATRIAVAANIGGLACGPLVGGFLARYAPWPLRVPYALDLLLVVFAIVGVLKARESVDSGTRRVRLRLQKLKLPAEVRGVFTRAAIAGVCAFAVAGVFTAIAPAFLGKELHAQSPVTAGLLVGSFFGPSALGQLMVGQVSKAAGLAWGCLVLCTGLGVLALAVATKSIPLLFLSGVISGLGQGMAVGFGLAEIHARAGDKRAETDSLYFVLLYTGVAVPTIGVGCVAMATGLVIAGLGFCGVVGACVLAVLVRLVSEPEPAE